jgi:hypothetical protein
MNTETKASDLLNQIQWDKATISIAKYTVDSTIIKTLTVEWDNLCLSVERKLYRLIKNDENGTYWKWHTVYTITPDCTIMMHNKLTEELPLTDDEFTAFSQECYRHNN